VSGWLLDTNVLSEVRKRGRADPAVLAFLSAADSFDCYIPVQAIGEIRRGVERLRRRGDATQADLLEAWLRQLVAGYANRILDFDRECAEAWGAFMAADPAHPVDAQIAAIAALHDLTVVTRNTADFAAISVATRNPFS